ncbi:MAG: YihY/virulence factor BrkB family protein [Methanolobus sp.]
MMSDHISLFRKTLDEWLADDGITNSAALAFHALVGIPSLLLFTLFVGSFFLKKQIIQASLVTDVSLFADDAAIKALNTLFTQLSVDNSFSFAFVISFFIYLWSAGNIFLQLQKLINKMWGLTEQKGNWFDQFLRKRASALVAAVVFGMLIIVSTMFEMVFFLISDNLNTAFSTPTLFVQFVSFGINFLTLVLLFVYIFRILPEAKPEWKYVFTGALMTVSLLTLSKYLMGFYLSYSSISSVYGTIGSILAIFLWIYMSSMIVTFMVEFTGVYSKMQ